MITIFNDSRDDKMIIGVVKLCETVEELDSVFGLFGISEYAKRVNILNRAMGADGTHYVGINNYPDAKEKYELNVQMFIEGSWKSARKISLANKIIEALELE